MIHANTISGSVQPGARPRRQRRASSAAPSVPSSTAGTPMYQNTQCRLIAQNTLGGLTRTCAAAWIGAAVTHRLQVGADGQADQDQDRQRGGRVRQPVRADLRQAAPPAHHHHDRRHDRDHRDGRHQRLQ